MDPGVFDAGLWLTEDQRRLILETKNNNSPDGQTYTELSATDYLEKRGSPLLVIYPIDLKTSYSESEKTAWGDQIGTLKKSIKSSLGEDTPLMAFAFGFPKKESGVAVKYRVNKVKLDEMNANLEIDDEEEGIEEEDDD
jgi:hypothetical protein